MLWFLSWWPYPTLLSVHDTFATFDVYLQIHDCVFRTIMFIAVNSSVGGKHLLGEYVWREVLIRRDLTLNLHGYVVLMLPFFWIHGTRRDTGNGCRWSQCFAILKFVIVPRKGCGMCLIGSGVPFRSLWMVMYAIAHVIRCYPFSGQNVPQSPFVGLTLRCAYL